jgi:hypothetical protein
MNGHFTEMTNISYNDFDFDVYRSVDVGSIEYLTFSPPLMEKSQLDIQGQGVALGDDSLSLFNDFLHSDGVPSLSDLEFCPISSTHVVLQNSCSEVSTTIIAFLSQNSINSSHNSSTQTWTCQSQNLDVKFQIQLYRQQEEYITVEFLRLKGSSLSYSAIFRLFQTSNTPREPTFASLPIVSTSLPPIESSAAERALLSWIDADSFEAVSALCSFDLVSTPFLATVCELVVQQQCLLSAAILCNYFLQLNHKMMSLVLADLDSLIPLIARKAVAPANDLLKQACVHIMERCLLIPDL